MTTVNRAIIVGYLGGDPKVTTNRAGGKIVNFSCATTKRWRDRSSGERKEATQWHRVVVFSAELVEIASQLRKGSHVYVSGSMETRIWEPDHGEKKYFAEIVLRPFGGELRDFGRGGGREGDLGQSDYDYSDSGPSPGGGEDRPDSDSSGSGFGRGAKPDRELDDDIPF